MRALPGFFAVLLSIALAVPGGNDGKAGANEVIALARAALGGEATLGAVRSLSASGTFRRPLPFGGGPTSGELELELSLADRRSARDGDRGWTGPVAAALLLPTPSGEVRFSYVGQVEAPHGRSDVVDITAPDGFAARLFLDQVSHLPLMLTCAGFPEAEPSTEEGGIPEPQLSSASASTLTLFLSDYREVGGILLPHSLARAVNGVLVEEWEIGGWRVNPPGPATSALSRRTTKVLPPLNDEGRARSSQEVPGTAPAQPPAATAELPGIHTPDHPVRGRDKPEPAPPPVQSRYLMQVLRRLNNSGTGQPVQCS